jgi:hypothetical protein
MIEDALNVRKRVLALSNANIMIQMPKSFNFSARIFNVTVVISPWLVLCIQEVFKGQDLGCT